MAAASWNYTYSTATQIGTGLYAASEPWSFTQGAAMQAPIVESVDPNGGGRRPSPKKILKSLQQRLFKHVSGAVQKFMCVAQRDQPDLSSAGNAASISILAPTTPPTAPIPASSPRNPNFKEHMRTALRGFQMPTRLSRMFSGSMVTTLAESESSSESFPCRPSKHCPKRPKLRSFPRYSRRFGRGRDPLESWNRGRPIWVRGFASNRVEYVYYKRKRHQEDAPLMSGAKDVSTSPEPAPPSGTSPDNAQLSRQDLWYRPQTQWIHVPTRQGSLFRHPSWPGISSLCVSPTSSRLGDVPAQLRRPALLLRPIQSPACTSSSTSGSYLRTFLSRLASSSPAVSPTQRASFQTPPSTSRFVLGLDISIEELDFETNEEDEDDEKALGSERGNASSMHDRHRRAAGRSTSFSDPMTLEWGSLWDQEGSTGCQPSQKSLVVMSAPQSNGEGPSRPSMASRNGTGPRAVEEEPSEDEDIIVGRMSRLGIAVNIRRIVPQEDEDGSEGGENK